jgi:hypothetical protein
MRSSLSGASAVALAFAALFTLSACSGPSLYYSGSITTSDDPHARDLATKRVPLRDHVVVVTRVSWLEDGSRGPHAVRWNWYEGDTLIAERAKTLDFARSPYRFSHSLPASDLGLGHYRVEVLVDGKKVDEQTFFVVES